jgi:hypothetical protein
MTINFRTYNGLAGDFHELLIAETDCGIKESVLFDRTSLFGLSFYFARKKLIRRIKNKKYEIRRIYKTV